MSCMSLYILMTVNGLVPQGVKASLVLDGSIDLDMLLAGVIVVVQSTVRVCQAAARQLAVGLAATRSTASEIHRYLRFVFCQSWR